MNHLQNVLIQVSVIAVLLVHNGHADDSISVRGHFERSHDPGDGRVDVITPGQMCFQRLSTGTTRDGVDEKPDETCVDECMMKYAGTYICDWTCQYPHLKH